MHVKNLQRAQSMAEDYSVLSKNAYSSLAVPSSQSMNHNQFQNQVQNSNATRFKGTYGRKIPVVNDRSQFHQGGNHDLYQNRSSEYLESVPEAKARQQSSRYVSEGQKIHYNIHVQDQSLQMKLKSMAGRYKKAQVDRSDKIKMTANNRKDVESNGSEEDSNFYE